MSVTGKRIVELARTHKGKTEIPPASNRGPFVEACQKATWLPGTGWPWCAAFVCYVAREAGVPLQFNSAGAHDIRDRYQKAGFGVTLAEAKPGDVIDFNIGSGHTGILVAKSGGNVITVDGNWANAVTEHATSQSLVRGVWRIPGVETSKPPPEPKKKLPPFVVATSMSGHRKVLFTGSKKGLVNWLTTHTLYRVAPNGITITRGKAR